MSRCALIESRMPRVDPTVVAIIIWYIKTSQPSLTLGGAVRRRRPPTARVRCRCMGRPWSLSLHQHTHTHFTHHHHLLLSAFCRANWHARMLRMYTTNIIIRTHARRVVSAAYSIRGLSP